MRRLLGALALLFVVGNLAARAYLDRHTPNFGYALIRRKWTTVLRTRTPADTVVIGDSSCLHGFDPDVAARILGGTVQNLCTIGDALVTNPVAMLTRLVRDGYAPRRVFLVHVYDVWHRQQSGYPLAQTPLSLAEVRSAFDFLTWDRTLTNEWLTDRFVPLVAENSSVIAVAKGLVSSKWRLEKLHHLEPTGFLPISAPDPKQVEQDVKEHLAFVRAEEPRISGANAAALEALLRVTEGAGIELTLVFAPMAEALSRDAAFMTHLTGIRRLVEQHLAGHPGVRVVPATPLVFPPTEMENADHVVQTAAARWTSAVVSESVAVRRRAAVP